MRRNFKWCRVYIRSRISMDFRSICQLHIGVRNSGNRYPPVVGPDGTSYQNNLYANVDDPQGKVMGWKLGTKYLSVVGGQAAIAEPQSLSIGGRIIYRNLCCDRLGSYFDIS